VAVLAEGQREMTLQTNTPCQVIEIWQPRWKDRKVLIAKFKVGTHNEIHFTGGPQKRIPDSLKGKFYVSGDTIRKSPLETNGSIDCYAVDLNELEPLERNNA
jgi:hypothetical protein